MPRRYPAEFRRKVLDLVESGRPVAQVAHDLGISDQTIYNWRRQHLIDTGQMPGITSSSGKTPSRCIGLRGRNETPLRRGDARGCGPWPTRR
ncbi:transposase [Saccharopolyspora erythraea]|uniref:transposase n=1 Tax=Saccharopolyspora erythraea TaxID=1836 RepID=UPI0018D3BA6C|nr:transposase [Saccharopolyspora erythraea]